MCSSTVMAPADLRCWWKLKQSVARCRMEKVTWPIWTTVVKQPHGLMRTASDNVPAPCFPSRPHCPLHPLPPPLPPRQDSVMIKEMKHLSVWTAF